MWDELLLPMAAETLDTASYLSSNPPNPRTQFRLGDWICARGHCAAHNFGRNLNCIGCGCPRSASFAPSATSSSSNVGPSPFALALGQNTALNPTLERAMNDQIFYSSAQPSWSTPSQQQQQQSSHQGAPSHSQRHTSSQNTHQQHQHVQQSHTPGPVDLAHLSSQFAGLTLPPQQQRSASSSHHGLGHPPSCSSQHGAPSFHHQGPHTVMGPGGGGHQAGSLPPKPSHPLLTPSGRAFAIGGRVQNVSSDPLAPCIMYWPDNEPFPEQSQIRPSNVVGGVAPPILNTGNRGPISHQPGDWICGKCNYLNWRRRKVCQTCLPYAEGNGDSISAAVQAERIALLTQVLSQASQGLTPSPSSHLSSSLLQPPNSAPALVTSMPMHGGPREAHGGMGMGMPGAMGRSGTGSLTPPQVRTRSSTTHLALGSHHHAPGSHAQGQLYSSSTSTTSQHPHLSSSPPHHAGIGSSSQQQLQHASLLNSMNVTAAAGSHHGHHGLGGGPMSHHHLGPASRDGQGNLNATAGGGSAPHGFQGNDAQAQGLFGLRGNNYLQASSHLHDGMGAIPSAQSSLGLGVQGRVQRSRSQVSLHGANVAGGLGGGLGGMVERGSSPMIYQTGSSTTSTPLTANINLPPSSSSSLHPLASNASRTGRAATMSLGHIQQLANQQQQAFLGSQQQHQGVTGSMHAPPQGGQPTQHERSQQQGQGLASSIHAPLPSSVPHPTTHRKEHHLQTVPQTIVESELYSTGPVPGAFSHPPSSAASSVTGNSRRGSASSGHGPSVSSGSPAPSVRRGSGSVAGSEGQQPLYETQGQRGQGERDGRQGVYDHGREAGERDQRRTDLRKSFPVLDDREGATSSSSPAHRELYSTSQPSHHHSTQHYASSQEISVHAPAPLLPSFLQDMVSSQDTQDAPGYSPPSLSPASASASETSSEPHEAESEEGHSVESSVDSQHPARPADLERRQSTARMVPSRPRVSSGSTDEEGNKPGAERSIWRVGVEEDVSLSRKSPPEGIRSVTGTFTPTTPSPFANITPTYAPSPNPFVPSTHLGLPRSGGSSAASSPSPFATPFAATPTAFGGNGHGHANAAAVGIIGMGRLR